MLDQLPIISVVGSHDKGLDIYAEPLGKMIAKFDYHLLVGPEDGASTSVAKAYTQQTNRAGFCIGVMPVYSDYDGAPLPRDQYPNPYIEMPILVPLDMKAERDINPFSRNQVDVMTANAVIALPGAHGTQNEVSLALRYNKPLLFFGPESAFASFPEHITCVDDIEAVREFLETVQMNVREKEEE